LTRAPAQRRLRVAVVITRLEGGAGILALHGARVLDPSQFEVTVITGGGDPLAQAARAAGLEVVAEPSLRAPIGPARDLLALRKLTSLLRRRRFGVVHTHTAKAGAIGRIAAHRAGVSRVIHTYHGFPFHEFQSPARRAAYVATERGLGRITDLGLCVGTGVAVEAVRRRLISPGRARVIGVAIGGGPGGLDPLAGPASQQPGGGWAPGPGARERARAALGLAAGATVVGAVGRLTYQKAPEDFLAALRQLGRPGVTGVWIGGGELSGPVSRLAAAQPSAPVVLAGDRPDVLDLLPAFDVFALPSRYEGLPTAVVEAMLANVPVVASAVNAVPDVVIPGQTGLLVPPRQPALLAAAIRQLLGSPAQAAAMAAEARARLGGRFSLAALREALTSAYLGD
jgi:glycosyltransferase involved in cell wall biosynthesis